jgi:hypothetical protein
MSGTTSEFQITDWRPRQTGTLQAFFTLTSPSGMIIRGCSVHKKTDRRWVNMPSREYALQGERKFEPVIAFTDRQAEDRFRLLALDAIDRHVSTRAE